MLTRQQPVGVVLAGGRGLRMGGGKLVVPLRGRALIEYPLAALQGALRDVAVIAKPDVQLPPLRGVLLWIEPEAPQHPLVGVVEALALAGGRPVLTCPADMPFVTPELITRLAEHPAEGAPAVIAACRDQVQPLLGRFEPEAAELLAPAARAGEAPVREAIAAIAPRRLELGDPDLLFNVNSPEDLLMAGAMLARDQPKVKS
jgi:molybdopterin-guanine dinucleotide biosynthesis protein A